MRAVGAERIAAALTLGKSFTLRAPGHDQDPSLASGALDPSLALKDWNVAQQNALLRRGIFAPSTYGRIRFHHRSTQEYLTAQWLDRLLRSNCPREEIWNLIFADRYGVETLVPSMRPAAAWLALKHSDIRGETIRREPLVLIRHGDPSSLSLDAKKEVLFSYVKKQALAQISDDNLGNRDLWLFSEPALVDAVREAWKLNSRSDFRMDPLRIIREGAITECTDLAREIACDDTAGDYHRIVALQALAECKDDVGLAAAAQHLVKKRKTSSVRLCSPAAKILFPKYLSVDDLIVLIDEHKASNKRGTRRSVSASKDPIRRSCVSLRALRARGYGTFLWPCAPISSWMCSKPLPRWRPFSLFCMGPAGRMGRVSRQATLCT